MPKKKAKIDWPSIDWTKENIVLARELGVSREYVRQQRQALFPPDWLRKPRKLVLEATVKATADKYSVPKMVASQWHKAAGLHVRRGRPEFVLPEDFLPTTLDADAKRLGVARYTLWRHMQSRGIAPGWGKGPGGTSIRCFTLPADFVPTTLTADGARFGVSAVTIRNAMIRQGIKAGPKTLPKFSPDGWAWAREKQGPA